MTAQSTQSITSRSRGTIPAMQTNDLSQTLTDLVAIRSVNPSGRDEYPPSSPEMVAYLESWFSRQGITTTRQNVGEREFNLLATLPGRDSAPTIVFDSHTDTVTADDWADRAFSPRLDAGRLYGRGSCDTKASMTAMMLAMREAASRPREERPNTIVLVASADEEYARTGLQAFLSTHPTIALAVVGEPTCCEPVIACKGAARWDLVVGGRSAHTSRPHTGVNAIRRMAGVISALERYEQTVLARKQHPLVDPATLTVSLIQGGTTVNVVPASCRITVDLRTMPQEDPVQAMRATTEWLRDSVDFTVEHQNLRVWNGADLPADHPLARECAACCEAELGRAAAPQGVNYGCHASDYSGNGIPAVVIGPGDIAVAHAIDEYVEIDAVAMASRIYHRIMMSGKIAGASNQ